MSVGSDSYVYWVEGHIGGVMKTYRAEITHDPITGLLIPPTTKTFEGFFKKNPRGPGYGETESEGGKFEESAKYRSNLFLIERNEQNDKQVIKTQLDPGF